MKRKRIPKKGTNDVSSNDEKTLNTWEMKQDSSVSDRDLNSEKTLNTWEMTQSADGELTDTEDGQIAESEESYTGPDSDNTSVDFT